MLSRHGRTQPISDFNEGRYSAKISKNENRDDQANPVNSPSAVQDFCDSCLRIPFGSDATHLWKNAWSRSAALSGALTIDYEKTIHEIKSGVLEECRWCAMLANATLLALNLDASYEAMAELNKSSASDSDEFEHDMVYEEDTEHVDDQRSGSEAEENMSNEETSSERSKITSQYDVFDVFDRCEISMTYLDDNARVGEPAEYKRLRVSADIYASSDEQESVGLIGHKSIEVELQVFSDISARSTTKTQRTTPQALDLSSDMTFILAAKLIDDCRKHEVCLRTGSQPSFTPTRLIDVRDKPKVYTRGKHITTEAVNYVALSYVWGKEQDYVAKTDWVECEDPFQLDVTRLPQLVLNAIDTTRKLGFNYLWIDSFCILQDSKDDKSRELAQMRRIYQNAYLTIAAAKSGSVDVPFLSLADPKYFMRPFNVPFFAVDGGQSSLLIGYRANYVSDMDPWNSRRWTLEEQLLSPRLLIYSINGLMWQCRSSIQDEQHLDGELKAFLGLPWNSDQTPMEEDIDTRRLWADILCNYTQREVTHAKGRLVAFAAVAEEFARIWEDEYIAGLWRSRLVSELLWHRDITSTWRWYLRLMPRPQKYRAPSWSWASIDGYVFGIDDEFPREPYEFEVLTCNADLESEIQPFGAVVNGTLRVKALLVPCTWRPTDDSIQDTCDGWLITPGEVEGELESTIDPAADVHLDALEPELKRSERIWCLPVARLTNRHLGRPFQGLVLKEVSPSTYQRIGYFQNCHDEYLFETRFPEKHEIDII